MNMFIERNPSWPHQITLGDIVQMSNVSPIMKNAGMMGTIVSRQGEGWIICLENNEMIWVPARPAWDKKESDFFYFKRVSKAK